MIPLSSLHEFEGSHKTKKMKKIFVVAAFITSQLSAQDSASVLTDVTVTANKFHTKTTETGKVVHIISRQDIERAGSRDLSQLLNEQGGMYINGANSNPGKDKNIYLRGARVEYTLVTIDGVPVYDASGIGNNFDIRQIPLEQVERVEILKGSQGTLYGSDAIAGVINIITRKGGQRPFQFSGSASTGSLDGVNSNQFFLLDTKKFNAAVSGRKDKFDYNVSGSHYSTDGISEARGSNAAPRYEDDAFSQNSFQASLGLQASSTWRLQPYLRYSAIRADLDQQPFVDEKDFSGLNKNLQTGINSQLSLKKGQLHIAYNFNNTSRDYTDDSTESQNGFFKYSNYLYESSEHFGEIFVVWPFKSWKLTTGLDLRSAAADYASDVVYQPSPFSPPGPVHAEQGRDSVRHQQGALYTAFNYHNPAGLNLETGARMNLHSEYGSHFALNVNPSYNLSNRLKIFANFSTGYRTPSLYQLFSEFGNKELEPETSVNIEGGLQVFSKDARANLRATWFNRKISDVMAFYVDPVSFRAMYINQDQQDDHGIEVDAGFRISEKLQLKAFYAWVDGEITTKTNGKDTSYYNLIRRPKSSFSLHAGSQLTSRLYISTLLQAIGKSKDIYYPPFTFAPAEIELDDYVLLHFYMEYGFHKNKLKAFADIRNLTGKTYSEVHGYTTPGFNWYVGLRASF